MSDDLVYRLRKRAEIRRQIPSRKSVQNNEPDRIADLLDEAADAITEWKTEAEKLFEESLDDALDALVGEINKDTLDWAQSQIDVLRNRVSELTKALELAHQHGSFEQGSGVLHTINDVLYGDQK